MHPIVLVGAGGLIGAVLRYLISGLVQNLTQSVTFPHGTFVVNIMEIIQMKLPANGQLLRIFIGESDKHEGIPLYEWLVIQAKEQGLAGATVLRGLMGFGANSRIHTSKILRLSLDLPIVVEIVDTPENIKAFLGRVESVIKEGLVTLEKAGVQIYRGSQQDE